MQSWKGTSFWLWLAVGAVVLVVVAIVAFLAMGRFDDTAPDNTGQASQIPPDRDKAATAAKALELGAVAKISSNYKVAVSELTLYKGEKAQYLAATIKAEYIGADTGEPWADLTVEFTDPEARVSDESGCPIDVGGASEDPPLDTGEVATYTACVDLSTPDIKDGKLSVEEALTRGRKAFWSTEGATTKKIPSIKPAYPAGQAPASRPSQYRSSRDDSDDEEVDWDEFDEDVEETNDWIEDMDKLVEQCKKASSCDDDKIEEYEDWRDDYKDRLEEYEDWKDKTGR